MPKRWPEYVADLPSSRPACFSDLGRASIGVSYTKLKYALIISEDHKETYLCLAVRIKSFHICTVSYPRDIPNDDNI
jgi:hypothetical protein